MWKERYSRRLLHHIQRGIYNKKRTPLCFLNQKLTNEQLKTLNSITDIESLNPKKRIDTISPLLATIFNGYYSTKTSLNINDFNKIDQQKILQIGQEQLPVFEKLINKKLSLSNTSDKCFILRYIGSNSKFNWHYDNEHDSCYRAAFLIKKKGNIPDFLIKDKNGKILNIKYDLGDGTLMKGRSTFHGVQKSTDKSCKRYMILFQYTTEPNHQYKSFCTIFQKPIDQFIIDLIPKLGIYWILKLYSHIFNYNCYISVNILTLIFFTTVMLSFFNYYLDQFPEFIGTHTPISLKELSKYYFIFLFHLLSPADTLIYCLYIISTELLLPGKLVNYI